MSDAIRLGAFTLEQPLSQGGMGTVWRARHRFTDVEVAVKVIANAVAQDPLYLEGFEREVRAVARMEHPRVVRVYDYGRVDSAAERSSGGDLPRMSPWLAMELATHQSLAQLPLLADWATLHAILFDILDALAHSHARGIIHRDLKPGNVLLTEGPDGLHCKLTDFGISHVAEQSVTTREVFASGAGTPWYMAPEQVEGRWRDYGPWTDLYALGCVAYQLASGITPFVGESALRIAKQQLFDQPSPLIPRFDVPDGFVQWVEGLMVKKVDHRCRRAADAAFALHQLSPRTGEPVRIAPPAISPGGVVTMDLRSRNSSLATLTFETSDLESSPSATTQPQITIPPGLQRSFRTPPVPEKWAPAETPKEATRLPGAGLGLYRLRETPFVGREQERDLLWSQLRRALGKPEMRGVVIRGGAGTGKSRLARWISDRAHELGVVSTMQAHHSPLGEQTDGLTQMFSQYLGCIGLDYERSYLRIRQLMTEGAAEPPDVINYYSAALARFLHPMGDAVGVPAVQFTNNDERYATVRRLSTGLADRRALLMVLDDVQWSYDTLEFALRLRNAGHPLLLVLTVRPDHLAARPLESELLREFEASDCVTTLELEPLSRRDYGRLVDRLLWLEPTLREEVLERSDQSPLFAAELIGDWVRRRVLRASAHGFRLDSTQEIPSNLHELWNRRVDRVLAMFDSPQQARDAVEVGAALGTFVVESEWHEVCRNLEMPIPHDLVDQLKASGLIERTDSGWTFVHQLLRESIEARARAAGRSPRYHRALAEALQFEESPDAQLRRALHQLEVGDDVEATEPLLAAAEAMLESGRVRAAKAVLATLAAVVSKLPVSHPQRRRLLEAQLDQLRHTADRDEILAFVESARPLALEHGWHSTLSALFRAEGSLAVDTGQIDIAIPRLEAALRHGQLAKSPDKVASAHRALGFVAIRFGETSVARDHFETARDHYQMANLPQRVSEALVGLAECELAVGNFAKAREYTDEALTICREGGFRATLTHHLSQRGDISAAAGDHTDARRFYAEAAELSLLIGNRHIYPIAVMNLGVSLIFIDQPVAARQRLREALQLVSADNLSLFVFYTDLALHAWLSARTGDVATWDEHFERLSADAIDDFALRESAANSLSAGEWWLSAGDSHRAGQALGLAVRLVPSALAGEFEGRAQTLRDAIQNSVSS